MKILLAHNDYARHSGEETVVDTMAILLQNRGHEIAFYRRSSSGKRERLLGQISGFFQGIYSPSGIRGMREAIREKNPDVINIHNLYPFISPAALSECHKAKIPVVMTVHNYRLICPTGLFMRNGAPCEKCLQRGDEWSCIRHNCEGAFPRSIGYALRGAYARWNKIFYQYVDRMVCLTDFQRQKLIDAGFDAAKIRVIPNTIDMPDAVIPTVGEYVAYCGRLSYEKGVDLLFAVATRHPEIRFKFAGEIRDHEMIPKNLPNNCELVGHLTQEQLGKFYRKAAFIVIPSRCYEGFPMAIPEAARYGKCVIGPDHGAFSNIIGQGLEAVGRLFESGNISALEQQIISLWQNPNLAKDLGMASYHKAYRCYSSTIVIQQWEQLFEEVRKN